MLLGMAAESVGWWEGVGAHVLCGGEGIKQALGTDGPGSPKSPDPGSALSLSTLLFDFLFFLDSM